MKQPLILWKITSVAQISVQWRAPFISPSGLLTDNFCSPMMPAPHPNRTDQLPRSLLVPEWRWWWGVIFKELFMRAPWRGGKLERTDRAWRTHFLDSLVPGPWLWWSCLTKAQVPLHVEPLPVSAVLTFTSGAPEGDQHTAPIFIPFKLLPFKAPTGCWKTDEPQTL